MCGLLAVSSFTYPMNRALLTKTFLLLIPARGRRGWRRPPPFRLMDQNSTSCGWRRRGGTRSCWCSTAGTGDRTASGSWSDFGIWRGVIGRGRFYAISKDRPEESFDLARKIEADKRGPVGYALLSDPQSITIDRYGLRDPAHAKEKINGVPRPSVFVLDQQGRVGGRRSRRIVGIGRRTKSSRPRWTRASDACLKAWLRRCRGATSVDRAGEGAGATQIQRCREALLRQGFARVAVPRSVASPERCTCSGAAKRCFALALHV